MVVRGRGRFVGVWWWGGVREGQVGVWSSKVCVGVGRRAGQTQVLYHLTLFSFFLY